MRCPTYDRVKYGGIGGVVLATGILAMLSGSYAFYAVFSPKVANALVAAPVDAPTVIKACVAGFVWALIIFNLDRFIVSSTGDGDGTDKITWREFQGAVPRLVMAVIIGLSLSAPLEVKIREAAKGASR
jgi:hypothetical protein